MGLVFSRDPGGYTMRRSTSQNGQPFWSDPQTIHHQLDSDIVASMVRGNEKCSLMMMMDPHFEPKKNLYHIKWTKDEINTLLEGMLVRSLEVLRNAEPSNVLFKEEVLWQSTPQFAEICRLMHLDPSVIRYEIRQIMSRYGKQVEFDLLAEFTHWVDFFAVEFKEKIGVKVVEQNLFKILLQHCDGQYELTTLLKQIGELMDDLYLAGYGRNEMVSLFAVSINKA